MKRAPGANRPPRAPRHGSLVGAEIAVVPDDDYPPVGAPAQPAFPYDRHDFDPGRPRYDQGGPGYYVPPHPQGPILPIFPRGGRQLFPAARDRFDGSHR